MDCLDFQEKPDDIVKYRIATSNLFKHLVNIAFTFDFHPSFQEYLLLY